MGLVMVLYSPTSGGGVITERPEAEVKSLLVKKKKKKRAAPIFSCWQRTATGGVTIGALD